MSATNPPKDPRYQYQDLRPASITVAQLDQLMGFVMDSGKGTIGAVVAGLKILVVTGYMFARQKLVSDEAEYKKQQYEQGQAGGNQGQVDQDDLGGQRRP